MATCPLQIVAQLLALLGLTCIRRRIDAARPPRCHGRVTQWTSCTRDLFARGQQRPCAPHSTSRDRKGGQRLGRPTVRKLKPRIFAYIDTRAEKGGVAGGAWGKALLEGGRACRGRQERHGLRGECRSRARAAACRQTGLRTGGKRLPPNA